MGSGSCSHDVFGYGDQWSLCGAAAPLRHVKFLRKEDRDPPAACPAAASRGAVRGAPGPQGGPAWTSERPSAA